MELKNLNELKKELNEKFNKEFSNEIIELKKDLIKIKEKINE